MLKSWRAFAWVWVQLVLTQDSRPSAGYADLVLTVVGVCFYSFLSELLYAEKGGLPLDTQRIKSRIIASRFLLNLDNRLSSEVRLFLTLPLLGVGIVKTTIKQQELLMTVARHPRPPDLQGLSIEDIAQRYIRQFRDISADWEAFEDSKIEGFNAHSIVL
ncbi:MAG: hypothetical protein CM1200mP36_05020 [Gammaproteobacteria bacterium]|nr:MAG: hypothetical protein CM1200mP36_05020 [Gammaproteobacteria bacterium]